jgi:hypothetical protein
MYVCLFAGHECIAPLILNFDTKWGCLASRSGPSAPGKEAPGNHWIEDGWVLEPVRMFRRGEQFLAHVGNWTTIPRSFHQ